MPIGLDKTVLGIASESVEMKKHQFKWHHPAAHDRRVGPKETSWQETMCQFNVPELLDSEDLMKTDSR